MSLPLNLSLDFRFIKVLVLNFVFTCFINMNIKAQAFDTLAIQDFEIVPETPTWIFSGPVIYNSGYSGVNAAPSNSPLGINGSRAWETTTVSGGLVLEFDNVLIPPGYDSIRVAFNLAAMNLNSIGGGPDNLDYFRVQYSLDGGMTYINRMEIRGAISDNSYWPYSATGFAKLNYLPATTIVFQPINSGLQTNLGFSKGEIVFPGSISQLRMKFTGRSSSSTDTWLADNITLTGENGLIKNVSTNVSYTSLQTAIDQAAINDSLILLDSIIENNITITKPIIINANNKTLTLNTNLTIPNGNSLTWINGTLDIPNGSTIINSGVLINKSIINYIDSYSNDGIYKGSGIFNGNFLNYGNVNPGN